jgi:cytochrome oxidase assembly protein ShyY1
VRLRPGEPAVDRRAPAGQIQRIDLAEVSRLAGEPVLAAYGVLASESPRPADAPEPLPRPDLDLGPHLSYFVQWFGFALAAYLIWAALLVREAQRRLAAREAALSPPGPADPPPGR